MGPRREHHLSPAAAARCRRAVSRSFREHRGVRGVLPGDLRPNRHDRGTPPGGGAAARTFWVAFRRHGDHGMEITVRSNKKRPSKIARSLSTWVAGGGFEPPTFGL